MANTKLTRRQKVGVGAFTVITLASANQAGFVSSLQLGLPTYLVAAAVCGALGGALLGTRRLWSGCLAGLIAGPCGLLAAYYYAMSDLAHDAILGSRDRLWIPGVMLVQAVASLPGVGLYYVLGTLSGTNGSPAKDGRD